jgi:hypothetical protein
LANKARTRSDFVMARSRHVASIRSAIASGNSIVMRLVGRSVRGGVMSFIRRFLHYLVAFSKRKRYILRMQQLHNADTGSVSIDAASLGRR